MERISTRLLAIAELLLSGEKFYCTTEIIIAFEQENEILSE